MPQAPAGSRAWLGATLMLLLLHCKGDKTVQPPSMDAGIEVSSGPSEPLDPGIGRLPPRVAGTMDVQNRYASTVMVTAEAESRDAQCSALLVHSRLALTAASCLCPQPGSGTGACPSRIHIRTVRYGEVGNWEFKEETTERHFHSYEGTVRTHPDFMVQRDSRGVLVQSRADLAVILLDTPVEEPLEEIRWAQTGAQAGEWLVMAGFGQELEGGGFPGIRYFRRNKVTQILDETWGQFLYEQQGAFLYEGFPGGPCFREQDQERWLVGIAGQVSKRGLLCTHLRSYQDWLRTLNPMFKKE